MYVYSGPLPRNECIQQLCLYFLSFKHANVITLDKYAGFMTQSSENDDRIDFINRSRKGKNLFLIFYMVAKFRQNTRITEIRTYQILS